MLSVSVLRARRIFAATLLLTGLIAGQTTVPSAGISFIENIQIPNWSTRGASWDLMAFNPQTRILYVADRTNHSVTAIDTKTDTLIGVLPIPSGGNTNGVLVVPELQQLVVTDGKTNVYVYDLRLPGNGPDAYSIPGITGGTDALDYDPLNHTVYIINGNRNYITGIDLLYKRIAGQASLPGSTELMRWNPNDGKIYQVITDGDNGTGVAIYDPVLNSITGFYKTTNCTPHGIEIDAPTNFALLGCGTTQAQILMNLKDGSVVKTFPDVTGADLLAYSPSTRHFYTGTGGNKSTTTGCPSNTDKTTFPIVGVISPLGSGSLVGVLCAGRGTKAVGVDPIQNLMFVAGTQYPTNPADANTGVSGVQVFFDPAPQAQALTTNSQATLAALPGGSASGTVKMKPMGRNIRLDTSLLGITPGRAIVNVTTTMGNEVVPCSTDSGSATAVCNGPLVGDPLIGGVVLLGIDGVPVAKGAITAGASQ